MRGSWFAGMTLLAVAAGCAAPGASDHKADSGAAPASAAAPAASSVATASGAASSAAAATGTAAPTARAQIGAWGVDLSGADPTVKPGDDFNRYANGHWLDTTQIPADRTSWTEFTLLAEKAQRDLRTIVESLPAQAPAGSTEQKVGDFYRAYLDTDAIEKLGLAPAEPGLKAIAAARTHADIARLMGRRDLGVRSPVRLGISADQKNPDRYIVTITQSGLGLPDRDYYLKSEPVYVDLRAKYAAHIARMLRLAGEKDSAQAARKAGYILDIETRIAQAHWPAAKRRERNLTYNLRSRAELDQQNPGLPWQALLAAQGLDTQSEFVLRELDAIQGLSKLFTQIPVEQWRAYCRYHYLASVADVLPHAFDAERFDFYGHALNGQPQQQERWKRGINGLDADIGEAVGRLYVQRYFPPSAKQQVLDLVENMRAAYGVRIRNLSWMSEATKQVALEKLAAFHPKIGYPDVWRDYSALEIRSGDAFGNSVRAQVFDWQRQLVRIGQPTDRGEWGLTPQTINAYYNAQFNEVVFPAAILQPPFFDPNADPAVNYGGVGAVIGHEMGHGFDDQGSKSDAHGVLRTWWQPADEEAFRRRVDSLAAQYDGFTALPGLNVNGRLTLGENIGDLGGLSVAYEAYHIALHGKAAPVLDGMTGDQRFFLAWAQVWRALYRDEQLRTLTLSNPHSPSNFRVIGPIRNIDAWYAAFDVKPGDKLYLAPEDRVHIW